MPAPLELRKKAQRCTELAADLSRAEDAAALRELATQLEQQADDAEDEAPPQSAPLH
jgi:hypothetical protein